MNIRQKERIFFLTSAIPILSLFTYSVCNEKVKKETNKTPDWKNREIIKQVRVSTFGSSGEIRLSKNIYRYYKNVCAAP